MRIFFVLFAAFLFLPSVLLAQEVGNRSSPQPSEYCALPKVKSYMDIILDPIHEEYTAFVYNLSANYRKNGIPKALVYRVNMSNLTDINICYEITGDGTGTTERGRVNFPYDPNAEGCSDFWIIFCPAYTGSGVPTDSDREACLGGTAIPIEKYGPGYPIDRCIPNANGLVQPNDYRTNPPYLASHNELYFCNQVPKDFAPLCWPLMLIFGLLVGAAYATGRNPFHVFDFAAPRMNRGRQYTARVQQKSFDLMGYVGATTSMASTAEKIGGLKEGSLSDWTPMGAVGYVVDKGTGALTKLLTPKGKTNKSTGGAKLNPKGQKASQYDDQGNLKAAIGDSKKPAQHGGQQPDGKKPAPESAVGAFVPDTVVDAKASPGGMVGTIMGAVGAGGGTSMPGKRSGGKGPTRAYLSTAAEGKGVAGSISAIAGSPNITDRVLGGFKGIGAEGEKPSELPRTGLTNPVDRSFAAQWSASQVVSQTEGLIAVVGGILSGDWTVAGRRTPKHAAFASQLEGIAAGEQKLLKERGLVDPDGKPKLTFGETLSSMWRQFSQVFSAALQQMLGKLSLDNLFDLKGENIAEKLLDLIRKIVNNALSIHQFLSNFSFTLKGFQGLSGGKAKGLAWFDKMNDRKLFALPMPNIPFIGKIGAGSFNVSLGMFANWASDTSSLPYGLSAFAPLVSGVKDIMNFLMTPSIAKDTAPVQYFERGGIVIVKGEDGMHAFDRDSPTKKISVNQAVEKMGFVDGGKAFKEWLDDGKAPAGVNDRSNFGEVFTAFGFKAEYGRQNQTNGKLEKTDEDSFRSDCETVATYKEAYKKLVDTLASDAYRSAQNITKKDEDLLKKSDQYQNDASASGLLPLTSLVHALENYEKEDKAVVGKSLQRLYGDEPIGIVPKDFNNLNDKELKKILGDVKDFREDTEGTRETLTKYNALANQSNALERQIQALRGTAGALDQTDAASKFKALQFYQQMYAASREQEMWARLEYEVAIENGKGGVVREVQDWLGEGKEGQAKILADLKAERKEHEDKLKTMGPEDDMASYSSEKFALVRLDTAIGLINQYSNANFDVKEKTMLLGAMDAANANIQNDASVLANANRAAAGAWSNGAQLGLDTETVGAVLADLSIAMKKGSFGQGQAGYNLLGPQSVLERFNSQIEQKLLENEGNFQKVSEDRNFMSKMGLMLDAGAAYSGAYASMDATSIERYNQLKGEIDGLVEKQRLSPPRIQMKIEKELVQLRCAIAEVRPAAEHVNNAKTLLNIVDLTPETQLQTYVFSSENNKNSFKAAADARGIVISQKDMDEIMRVQEGNSAYISSNKNPYSVELKDGKLNVYLQMEFKLPGVVVPVIADFKALGVSEESLKKLQKDGYDDIGKIAHTPPDQLYKIAKIVGLETANKMVAEAQLVIKSSSDKVTLDALVKDPEAYAPYLSEMLVQTAKANLDATFQKLSERQRDGTYSGSPLETLQGEKRKSSAVAMMKFIEDAQDGLQAGMRSVTVLSQPTSTEKQILDDPKASKADKNLIDIARSERVREAWDNLAGQFSKLAEDVSGKENRMYMTSKKYVSDFMSKNIPAWTDAAYMRDPKADFISEYRKKIGEPRIYNVMPWESQHGAAVSGIREGMDLGPMNEQLADIKQKAGIPVEEPRKSTISPELLFKPTALELPFEGAPEKQPSTKGPQTTPSEAPAGSSAEAKGEKPKTGKSLGWTPDEKAPDITKQSVAKQMMETEQEEERKTRSGRKKPSSRDDDRL